MLELTGGSLLLGGLLGGQRLLGRQHAARRGLPVGISLCLVVEDGHAEQDRKSDAAAGVEQLAAADVVVVPLLVVLAQHAAALIGPAGHGLPEVVREHSMGNFVR